MRLSSTSKPTTIASRKLNKATQAQAAIEHTVRNVEASKDDRLG